MADSQSRKNASVPARPRRRRSDWVFYDLAEDILARDGSENPAVGTVVAIVAHDEELVSAHANEGVPTPTIRVGRGVGQKVRFTQKLSVDIHPAPFETDELPRRRDDPLHIQTIIEWVLQRDNVFPAGFSYDIAQPIHPIMSSVRKRGIHARALHFGSLG